MKPLNVNNSIKNNKVKATYLISSSKAANQQGKRSLENVLQQGKRYIKSQEDISKSLDKQCLI